MDWTEKHRPHSLEDVVGHGTAVRTMRQWAAAWQEGVPKVRALVLSGPPGVGKTSAALALARDMGWPVIELNASDARNADKIRRVATAGALHQTFAADGAFLSAAEGSGRKLIVLDEADNLYERLVGESAAGGGGAEYSDRGGKTQIIDTIRRTQQPIVLIVNDLYELTKGSGAALKSLAQTVKFTRVHTRSIPAVLERIARTEGVQVDRPVLEAIADKAGGDLRAAVRDLESLCAGRERVTLQDLGALGYRDVTGSMFDAVRHILKGRALAELRREVRDLDATPEDLVLWLDENMPREYQHPEDLVRGYDALSRADVFLGRTRRTQDYRLWAYASDLAAGGVMVARRHQYKQFVPFGFPQYLLKMSRSKGARAVKDRLAERLGRGTHLSKRKARTEMVPVFEALFQGDEGFAARQAHTLELGDEQVALLLGENPTSARVKRIRAATEALAAAAGPAEASGPLASFAAQGDRRRAARTGSRGAKGEDAQEGDVSDGEPGDGESGDAGGSDEHEAGDAGAHDASGAGSVADDAAKDAAAQEGRGRRQRAPAEGQQRLF